MENFETYLKKENVSHNTVSAYLTAIKQYHTWYEGTFGDPALLYRPADFRSCKLKAVEYLF